MMLLSTLAVALLPYLVAHVHAFDYTAGFGTNYNVSGFKESSFPAGSLLDGQCTSSKQCHGGFKCTALPSAAESVSKLDASRSLPSFCVAPPKLYPCPDGIKVPYTFWNFHPKCCRCAIDLAYLVDRSGSMVDEFASSIHFLKQVTTDLENVAQHPFCVRIGVASFAGPSAGSSAQSHLTLVAGTGSLWSGLDAVKNALNAIPSPSGGSPLAAGMLFAQTMIEDGDRWFAPNVMLVLTDYLLVYAPAVTVVSDASNAIRSKGTCINAVGTSTAATLSDTTMLQAITGSPDVIWYQQHTQLSQIHLEVQQSLCDKCKSACYGCPEGYTLYEGACYRTVGPACFLNGYGLCAAVGGTFTQNQQAALTIGGPTAWYQNSATVINSILYCITAGGQCIQCCEDRPIVCETMCTGFWPSAKQIYRYEQASLTNAQKDTDGVAIKSFK